MQEPSGYIIKNGKAQMTDFFSLITSEHLWLQFPHMLMSGFVTGSIFVIGISSYHLLKKNHTDFFKKSLKINFSMSYHETFIKTLEEKESNAMEVATQET